MPLILSEEQEMLQESARGFLAEKAPVSALRKLRDERSEEGFSRALWKEMAEMGWAGILVDEAHGGSGFGFRQRTIWARFQRRFWPIHWPSRLPRRTAPSDA